MIDVPEPNVRPLQPDDLDALLAIRQEAYLDSSDHSAPHVRDHHLRSFAYKTGCFVGEAQELAASAAWFPFEMNYGGQAHTMVGLASVLTAASQRRRGYVRALLAEGLQRYCEQGTGWSLEFPFDTRFYARYGWTTIPAGCFVEVPIERFHDPGVQHTIARVYPTRDPDVIAPMHEIYQRFAANYNFTMARRDTVRPHWGMIAGDAAWWSKITRLCYLSDDAYCVMIIRPEGHDAQRLIVIDWAYTSASARRRLFAFWGSLAGQVNTIKVQLPTDAPELAEWSNYQLKHPHPLQARIVNVQKALTMVPSVAARDEFSLVLDIDDSFCPANTQRLHYCVGPKGADVSPTQATPDIRASIDGLAKVLSGAVSPRVAHHLRCVEGSAEAIRTLMRVVRHPCYLSMADYF